VTTARHVIFGTGAIGLATCDALRRRGETVRLVNRSGHAPVADDVEVAGGDARDPAFTTAAAQGACVVYQTLNPPYPEWAAQFPALQAGVLAAAEAADARLVSGDGRAVPLSDPEDLGVAVPVLRHRTHRGGAGVG
jgi:uncharacterized protein YbjT (DUF2867 family)